MPSQPGHIGPRPGLVHSRDIEPTAHWAALLEEIERQGSLIVAFSGGVDSTLLAKVAHDILGPKALAVLAVSPSLAAGERAEAPALASLIGIAYREIRTAEGEDPRYVANASDRCYFCKAHLFQGLADLQLAAPTLVPGARLAYGATKDDLKDHRPGMRAAEDAAALAPFVVAGLGKDEIREASRRLGLPTWNKPALACLASRVAYGTEVTPERLARVDAAERAVRSLGFRQLRVRDLGDGARVEIDPVELPAALERSEAIASAVHQAGFTRVEIDPSGYRSGRLNEALTHPERKS